MADFSDFRPSQNIDDRRNTPFVPIPGVFGNGIDLGNVFDSGDLTGLNAKTDFFPQPNKPNQMSIDLGVNSLPSSYPTVSGATATPLGVLGNIPNSAPLDQQYTDAIKGFEGYSPNASWDYKQSSSGYGTKAQPGDENIPPDQLRAVHEQRFSDEVGKAAASVDQFAPNLPPGVRAALSSLTYNAGPGWQNSGLGQAVKSGDFDKAQNLFLQYNKAGGDVNPGLVARRQKEAAWFGSTSPQAAPAAPVQIAQASPASPANAIPQQTQAPIFAPAPQQAAQSPTPGFAQIPQAPLPQINFAQHRPVDLSTLRAYLARNS